MLSLELYHSDSFRDAKWVNPARTEGGVHGAGPAWHWATHRAGTCLTTRFDLLKQADVKKCVCDGGWTGEDCAQSMVG